MRSIFVFINGCVVLRANNNLTIEQFIPAQKIIRAYPSGMPRGSGDQAACLNLMSWLRMKGFQGIFEVIYQTANAPQILSLFGMSIDTPPDYYDATQKIKFIRFVDYYQRFQNNEIESVNLAVSGGRGDSLCYSAEEDSGIKIDKAICSNDAVLMKVNLAMIISPWMGDKQQIQYSDSERIYLSGTEKTFFVMPVASLDDAKNHLNILSETQNENDEQRARAISMINLIKKLEDKVINLLPIYGYSMQDNDVQCKACFPGNILKLITGLRFAMMNEEKIRSKPIVLAVFYDYTKEIEQLNKIIIQNNWQAYQSIGANEAKQIIQELDLANHFLTAKLIDFDQISFEAGNIILISMGSYIPQVVFNGIFNHYADNNWLSVREGQNSMNTLILKGKPDLRVGAGGKTAENIGYAAKGEVHHIISNSIISGGLKSFVDQEQYRLVGKFIMESYNNSSPLSEYFHELQQIALKPENDRAGLALTRGIQSLRITDHEFHQSRQVASTPSNVSTKFHVDITSTPTNTTFQNDKEFQQDDSAHKNSDTSQKSYSGQFELDAAIILSTFTIACIYKYCISPLLTLLPWNKKYNLTAIQRDKVNAYQQELEELSQQIDAKRNKRAFKHGINSSQYYEINQLMLKSIQLINSINRSHQISTAEMSTLDRIIPEIRLLMPKLTNRELERQLRYHEIKLDRISRHRT